MAVAQYDHQCSQCESTYTKDQAWIDPEQFTKPEQAVMTVTFWCPRCERGQGLKLKMLPEQQVEVTEKLKYNLLMNENSPSYYSPAKKDDKDEENEKVQTITEKKALEILSVLR